METTDRRVWIIGLLALTAYAAIPFLYAIAVGAASIPHNDDWAFLRVLFHLVENGQIRLVGMSEMMLLGHLAWAYPLVALLGENVGVLSAANTLFTAAGIVLSCVLARRFLPIPYALGVGALVATFPGYAHTTVSYMTDPSALVAQLGCLLLGISALRSEGRRSTILFGLSMLVGFYSFSIREFSILAPLAVVAGMVALTLRDKRSWWVPGAGLGLLLATSVTLYLLRQSLPGGVSHLFGTPGAIKVLVLAGQALFTVGLALSPAVALLLVTRRDLAARSINVGALLAFVLAILVLQYSPTVPTCCEDSGASLFVGNSITQQGFLGNQALFGVRPPLFPSPYWLLLSTIGLTSGTIALGLLWSGTMQWLRGEDRMLDPSEWVLVAWGVGTVAALITRSALGGPLFDRYLSVLVLIGAVAILRAAPAPRWDRAALPAFTLLVFLAVTSLALVTSGLAFDAARWKAGERAVRSGVPASHVDAGIEWVGFHYEGVAGEDLPPVSPRLDPSYTQLFPAAGNCIVVAGGPLVAPGLTLVDRQPYRVWFGLRTFELQVFKNEPACGAGGG